MGEVWWPNHSNLQANTLWPCPCPRFPPYHRRHPWPKIRSTDDDGASHRVLVLHGHCMAFRKYHEMRYHHFYCWVLEVEKCGNILKNQPLPTIFAAAQFHPQTLGLAIAILDLCTSLLCTLKFGLVQSFWLSLYPHQQTSTSEEVRRWQGRPIPRHFSYRKDPSLCSCQPGSWGWRWRLDNWQQLTLGRWTLNCLPALITSFNLLRRHCHEHLSRETLCWPRGQRNCAHLLLSASRWIKEGLYVYTMARAVSPMFLDIWAVPLLRPAARGQISSDSQRIAAVVFRPARDSLHEIPWKADCARLSGMQRPWPSATIGDHQVMPNMQWPGHYCPDCFRPCQHASMPPATSGPVLDGVVQLEDMGWLSPSMTPPNSKTGCSCGTRVVEMQLSLLMTDLRARTKAMWNRQNNPRSTVQWLYICQVKLPKATSLIDGDASIYIYIYLFIYLLIDLFIYAFIHSFIYLYIYLFIDLYIYIFIYFSYQ